MSPISLGIEISEKQTLLKTLVDSGNSSGNFACYKSRTTARRLVIEQNSIGSMHPIGFTVVHNNPVSILLGNSVRRARVERRFFSLRSLHDFSIKFRCRSLIESNLVGQTSSSNSIKQTKCPKTIDVTSVLSHLERDFDMRLSSKIVDLMRLNLGDDTDQVGGICKISIVQEELGRVHMAINVDMLNTSSIKGRRSSNDAVDLIPLLEEELG